MNRLAGAAGSAWRPWLIAAALLILGPGFAASAAADALGDFISAYEEIESYAPSNSLPVSSADFKASKGLFDCLAGADVGDASNDPLVCVNKFHDTPLGKKASAEGGIPETFWRVVDAYIAYLEKDYWGVAYHLGEAAVCAVVQVLLGGVDACSLIKELVELAEDIYDAAKWTVEFLEDVGGAAADVGTCIVTLGSDCGDDSPPPPPETYVYEYVFLTRVDEGVAKRELSDGSYEKYVQSLVQNAAHKPYPILSKPWLSGEEGPFGAKQMLYPNFTSTAIAKAQALYEKAVDTKWSTHVLQEVLPQLGMERMQYLDAQLPAVAKQAAQAYLNNQYPSPDAAVKSICLDHFTKNRPYKHVDLWIALHGVEAGKYNAVNNPDWCAQEFWGQKTAFATHFRAYVVAGKLCPEFGATLVCQSLSSYTACKGLMGSVSQQAQCDMNVQYVGVGIAQEIVAYFKSKGSVYAGSCEIPKLLSSPQSKSPAVLRCHRPTLQYHCGKYYQDHYGSGPNALPVKALECELGVKHPADYQAREDKTWGSMVPALAAKRPEIQPYVSAKGYDPLRILVPPKVFGAVAGDASALGFQLKTGTDTQPSLDGEEEPTLGSSLEGVVKDTKSTVPAGTFAELNAGGVNPPDPTGKLTTASGPAGAAITGASQAQVGVIQQELPQSQVMSGELPDAGPKADTPGTESRAEATGVAETRAAGVVESAGIVGHEPVGHDSTATGMATSDTPAQASASAAADPQSSTCEFELSYLAPQPPALETTSATLAVGDQVRITCRYALASRRVALPACDEQARRTAETFRAPGAATSRVLSGIVAVDGQFIGVSSIPADSRRYEKTAIWSFSEAGSHTVSCQVDNPLASQLRGADAYVAEAISVEVGAVSATGAPVGFDPAQARPLPARAVAPPTRLLPPGARSAAPAPMAAGTQPVGPAEQAPGARDAATTVEGARDASTRLPAVQAVPAPGSARESAGSVAATGRGAVRDVPPEDEASAAPIRSDVTTELPAVQGVAAPRVAPARAASGGASTQLPAVQRPNEEQGIEAKSAERTAPNALREPSAGHGRDAGSKTAACDLPVAAGPCKAAVTRYAFDRATGQCQPFLYGGCQGNANNFATLQACQQHCAAGNGR